MRGSPGTPARALTWSNRRQVVTWEGKTKLKRTVVSSNR